MLVVIFAVVSTDSTVYMPDSSMYFFIIFIWLGNELDCRRSRLNCFNNFNNI